MALDAGVQLSAIARILEKTQPPGLGKSDGLSLPHTLTAGPFTGLVVPFASAEANAAYIHKDLIDAYLITHPHLDHISGFVINTAGPPGQRPKRLAGLPSTIAAFKTHIFNNVIWPNLSDENNGAGLVTYMRLVEGGSPALGSGEGKGYMEVSNGLAVKIWGVSHGHCIEKHSHRGSGSNNTRYGSMEAASMSLAMGTMGMGMGPNTPHMTPRGLVHHSTINPGLSVALQQQQQREQMHIPGTPQGILAGSSAPSGGQRAASVSGAGAQSETVCVYDSSACFIRDVATGCEILMFGDVEPDSISLSPRNHQVWQEAAPKIAAGNLAAIFIECSYDNSQSVDRLFGHLTPKFLMQEMANLAAEVRAVRRQMTPETTRQMTPQEDARETSDSQGKAVRLNRHKKKRKRAAADSPMVTRRMATRSITSASSNPSSLMTADEPVSPRTVKASRESSTLPHAMAPPDEPGSASSASGWTPHLSTPTADLSLHELESSGPATPSSVRRSMTPVPHEPFPLKGLKVVLIHMKEKLEDGPPVGETILGELLAHEEEAQLGCEFVISHPGESLYF